MTAKHHPDDTAFFRASRGMGHLTRRTIAGGKKHFVSISVAAVLSGVAGTFIPMLENHWSAQDQKEAIASAVAPLQNQITDLKQQIHDSNQAQWQAINRKRDK
jgi:cell division protein FtsL